MIKDEIKRQIQIRIINRAPVKTIAQLLGEGCNFVIAGNALNRETPHDFDIYSASDDTIFDFDDIKINIENSTMSKCYVICETKNALTVSANSDVIQFCKYAKENPQKLIESFDFAHCQIAAEFKNIDTGKTPVLSNIYFTDDWLIAKGIESTYYTGTEFPLSSLIRLVKYTQRGMFLGNQYKYEMLKILNDIIKRGFDDYEDFKDQMDSIDLGLLEDADSENAAYELYLSCKASNLVRN